jgi:CRP-like cAMP-binding protein
MPDRHQRSGVGYPDTFTPRPGHKQAAIKNAILRNFAWSDLACIGPFLRPIALKERAVLQEPKKRVEYITFIETGIVSLRTISTGCILETAMVGPHGAVGASIALGTDTSMHQSIVLVSGSALRIYADDLRRLMAERPQIREHLLQYIEALMIHGSQTALCGVRHELEQRLACWLCVACDALEGDVLPITHDHLSTILGLRRAGLTEALIRFEEQGLIRKSRGVMRVRERALLEQKACNCYGVIASAYDRAKSLGLRAPEAAVEASKCWSVASDGSLIGLLAHHHAAVK